ncbi:hypothetical protein LTR27_011737 [Elasticomyces elasticus]|nr:hypothetical protein LTR27_011737 [Elasticomyces elasticus]
MLLGIFALSMVLAPSVSAGLGNGWSDWAKYRILLTGYMDSKCVSQAGKPTYTKSTWNCSDLDVPAHGFVYQFAQHKSNDDPEDKHCRLILYEGQGCTGRSDDDIHEASAWLGWCMNRERDMHGVEHRDKWPVKSIQVDCYGGNHHRDPDIPADDSRLLDE